jgi:hypothetical protein
MSDSSFLQSNKELKLIDAGDGTFHQSVAISGEGITIDNVDISGLNTISTIEQVLNVPSVDVIDTVSAVEEVVKVGTLLDGTVSISNASIPVTGTVSVEGVTVEEINTISVVEEVVKVGTLLDGTVTVENANFEVSGTVSIESNVLTSVSHTTASITTATSTTVLNANSNRNYVVITNPNTNPVYIGLGQEADDGKGIYLPEDTAYEMSSAYNNLYRGQISAISPASDSVILITEGE